MPAAKPMAVDVVLVVPDDGASVIALDAYDGSRLASFAGEAPPTAKRLVSAPLVTPDGIVIVAHQGYVPEEAAVVVLHLDAPEPESAAAKPEDAPAAPL